MCLCVCARARVCVCVQRQGDFELVLSSTFTWVLVLELTSPGPFLCIFMKIHFYFMCLVFCLNMCKCTAFVPGTYVAQRETKILEIVTMHVLGTEPGSSARTERANVYGAIPPALLLQLLYG